MSKKSGEIAFDKMIELNNLGIDTNLTVVGCIPLQNYSSKKLNVIPFLDKNKNEDKEIL